MIAHPAGSPAAEDPQQQACDHSLHRHQVEAIRLGTTDKDFIVTSGTGSGKSLTYIGTIFHHLLSHPTAQGVTAVVVYPIRPHQLTVR